MGGGTIEVVNGVGISLCPMTKIPLLDELARLRVIYSSPPSSSGISAPSEPQFSSELDASPPRFPMGSPLEGDGMTPGRGY